MAILQISRITNRKGLTDDLPQLSGAELGWCTDSRRLFIGNGTLAEGAPVIGNTEILTQFSDITVLSNYTYQDIAVGYAAQTGPNPGTPTVRTVQAKLDDIASVRDFGAVGDGVADDGPAINRALFQLFCRENYSLARRMLYFPAGTYRTQEPILIPTYAKLVGEGANCTIITYEPDDSGLGYVAQFADSLQQTGSDIGNNGAVPPRNIEISGMSFETDLISDVFLVDQARQCWFESVFFRSGVSIEAIADPGFDPDGADDVAGIRFFSGSLPPAGSQSINFCNDITFDRCRISNVTRGIATDQQIQGITVSNTEFDQLYIGIELNALVDPPVTPYQAGPTGFRAVHNIFNNIYAQGIIYGTVNLNVSAYNIFYDVANQFGTQAAYPVITFDYDNNISVGDMFSRTDSEVVLYQPRIQVLGTATDTGSGIQLGTYYQDRGRSITLLDNTADQVIYTASAITNPTFELRYSLTRDTEHRQGTIYVVAGPSNDPSPDCTYSEDYVENDDTGATVTVVQVSSIISVRFTLNSTGNDATLRYTVSYLD